MQLNLYSQNKSNRKFKSANLYMHDKYHSVVNYGTPKRHLMWSSNWWCTLTISDVLMCTRSVMGTVIGDAYIHDRWRTCARDRWWWWWVWSVTHIHDQWWTFTTGDQLCNWWCKSRSSKFFFVHPKFTYKCTQSVSMVVYYMYNVHYIYRKKLYMYMYTASPLWCIHLLPLPWLYRNLGMISG